jgi:hypothetical protein
MTQHRPHSDQGEQQRAGSRPERHGGGLHLPGGGRLPTVQQMGFALGAALAGVNGSPVGAADDAMMRQAFWVPACFVVPAAIACLASLRLYQLRKP